MKVKNQKSAADYGVMKTGNRPKIIVNKEVNLSGNSGRATVSNLTTKVMTTHARTLKLLADK